MEGLDSLMLKKEIQTMSMMHFCVALLPPLRHGRNGES